MTTGRASRPFSSGATHDSRASRVSGPLAGLRVVEFAHIMAGPTCGRMLADMGADVIKVEPVAGGDATRGFRPPNLDGESAAFMMLNRNKRGVALDLKSEAGLEVARRLADRADVLIENHRTGTMDRLGLGYDLLKKTNPGLIYCEISGFGRTGPMAHLGGFDLISQGYSGIMSVTGEGEGRPPVKCAPPLTDITAGVLAAMGILAAYINRIETGRGQRIDTSLFEAGVTQSFWQAAVTLATGISPRPLGSAHPLTAPYQAFETSDGWITVGGSNQATWRRLVEVVGLPDLAEDPRFLENADRMQNVNELASVLGERFKTRPTAEWLGLLEEGGVPAGPVASIGDMLEFPQTLARDMVVEVEHSKLGPVRTIGFPVKFSGTPVSVERGAPLLGEHTREVLAELGYSGGEIEELIGSGVARV
jgi:crotonobetainyl-CoA:carnitine CoA-transferase CaiB-like acyl-CoA transferase